MAQKIFFRKRRKVPEQLQIFFLFLFVLLLFMPILYFFGFQKLPSYEAIESRKVENRLAVTITNRWLRFSNEFRQNVNTLEDLFLQHGNLPNWNLSFHKDDQDSLYMLYGKPIEKIENKDSALLFVFQLGKHGQVNNSYAYSLFSGFSLMETVQEDNETPVFVVFSFGNHKDSIKQIQSQIQKTHSIEAALVFAPSLKDTAHFSTAGLKGNTSNPQWFSLLNHFEKNLSLETASLIYGSFLEQWLYGGLPFLQKDVGVLLSGFTPALGWYYSTEQKNFHSLQATKYTQAFLKVIDNWQKKELNNSSFFIKDLGMLKPVYFWIIVFLSFLFIWFHFFNLAFLGGEAFEPARGILSFLYFSLVAIFYYLTLHGSVAFGLANEWFSGVVVILAFFFYLFWKRIASKFIIVHSNSLTSLFFFYFFLSFLIWFNPVLFLTLLPIGIFWAGIRQSSFIGAFLLFVLGLAVPFAFVYIIIQMFPHLQILRADFLSTEVFSNWKTFLPFSFAVGSLISLITRE